MGDVEGFIVLEERVTRLADVLSARDFPLEHLADDLEIAADVTGGHRAAVAERLRSAAALVRAR